MADSFRSDSFVPDPTPTAPAVSRAPSDMIGDIKAHLVREPPADDPRNNPIASGIRTAGRFILPGSWPGVAAFGASALPGAGPLMALARGALGAGAGAGVEAIRGGDPMSGAAEAATSVLGGEVLGAAGRAGARYAQARLEPFTRNVADAIGKIVPAFRGKTPQDTVAKALSNEGQQALSSQFSKSVDDVIERNGDPQMAVISLARVTGKDTDAFGNASEILRKLQSLEREWRTVRRDPTRRHEALLKLEQIEQAHGDFVKGLRKLMPKEGDFLTAAEGAYRKGKEIQRWLGGGPERMTEGRIGRLVERGRDTDPHLNAPMLQESLMLRRGSLASALSKDEFAALQQAVTRGEANPLARDIPGSAPHLSWWGALPIPHLHGLPHAPRMIGGKSEANAETVAEAMRLLGNRATNQAINP